MTTLREGTPEEAGMDPTQIELIRQRGAQWAQQGNTLGLQLLVARRGVICLHDAYGRTSPQPDANPVTTDSYFYVASNTKMITATAVMMLVEEGLLGLSRPVRFYIPEFLAPGTEEILVQQLLTHTSGYDRETTPLQVAEVLDAGLDLPPCPADQHPALHASLQALLQVGPAKKPGAQMTYANENYELLGEIVRRVSGMSFSDFLVERIIRPLGMDGVRVGLDPAIESDFVFDFSVPLGEGVPSGDALRELFTHPHPAANLFARARDYAAFLQMLLNKGYYGDAQILHPITVAQMTRNQVPGIRAEFFGRSIAEAGWGYGPAIVQTQRWPWTVGTLVKDGAISHGGGGGTTFWVDPATDVVGVYFSYCTKFDPVTLEPAWDFDLFQNMVTAAVV